jgi:MFS family permease
LDADRWRSLAVILSAAFLVGLDFFVVNVAIPSIQIDLHATFAQIQLVIASYGLTYAVFLISGGRLGDIYGRKRLFMLGISGFILTSLFCGLAHSPNVLIAARALQGFTGALLFPQVLSIIQVTFPAKQRAAAFGFFGMVIGISAFSGNVLGGLLVYANFWGLGWRPIFLINLPLGLLTLWAAVLLIKESRSPMARRLDLGGVAILTTALSMLMYPLIKGRELGWPFWTFVSLGLSLLMFAGFVQFERLVSARGGSPLIELRLFHDRTFVIGLLSGVCFFNTTASFFFISTIFLQNGLGYSAKDAGLAFASFAVAFLLSSLSSVRVQPKLGSWIINLGLVLMIAGLVTLLSMAGLYGARITMLLAPAFLIYGTGQGFVMPTLFSTILINIKGQDAGSASGVLSTVQQVSFAMGVAVIGTVFFGALDGHGNVAGFVHALRTAFTVNLSLLAATFIMVLNVPRFPIRSTEQ